MLVSDLQDTELLARLRFHLARKSEYNLFEAFPSPLVENVRVIYARIAVN
jgi:hypothetical protein